MAPAKEPEPTGLASVDALGSMPATLDLYVAGASEYIRSSSTISPGQKKAAQIRLSIALGHALSAALRERVPDMSLHVGERTVAGGLRSMQADVSELHQLDGLRLAVELKPVMLAVGRAIWNRFGDLRMFSVNLHLKFPFAVVGGVLAIPTYEVHEVTGAKKSTVNLIERAIARLARAGGRVTEGDAPHLLEGVGVVVYDPDSGLLDSSLPPEGSGLRWDEFVEGLATAYAARFIE